MSGAVNITPSAVTSKRSYMHFGCQPGILPDGAVVFLNEFRLSEAFEQCWRRRLYIFTKDFLEFVIVCLSVY